MGFRTDFVAGVLSYPLSFPFFLVISSDSEKSHCFRQGEGRDASPAVISKRSEKSCLSAEI